MCDGTDSGDGFPKLPLPGDICEPRRDSPRQETYQEIQALVPHAGNDQGLAFQQTRNAASRNVGSTQRDPLLLITVMFIAPLALGLLGVRRAATAGEAGRPGSCWESSSP
ncbi:MAG: hypothetical protein OSA98_09165 [Rubripirellula sp.]|nr:hypothetical protein [Rubripirellula sp.]